MNITKKFIGLFLVLGLGVQYTAFCQESRDSLDIKIGQMIMIGFSGTAVTNDDPILDEIVNGTIGGVILFEKNISDSNSYVRLKNLTFTLERKASIPLFMAIDQEGGKVNRLKTKYGFPKSVTAEYLGSLDNPDSTRFYAEMTAATLTGLGFNINFSPVLDLAINPDNPVIVKHGRSYGADPKVVVRNASIVIRTHRKLGVITVGKHFPGHGSSMTDTHLGVADVTNTWQPVELEPYKELVSRDLLDGVMSAHIVNKKLDPQGLPGTLSGPILQGLLRDSIHYDGVVFSDDMQMHAITKYYGLEKAVRLGINAGLDVVIFSNNIDQSDLRTAGVVHDLIRSMVESGAIKRSRIDQAYQRIMSLKHTYLYAH